MNQLKQSVEKSYGASLSSERLKYYYYDSDDDRIDISDDEELEEAMNHCKSKCLKIYVQNYDISKDPFFQSLEPSKSDGNTGPSTENRKGDRKMSDFAFSAKSCEFESLSSSAANRKHSNFEEYKRAFDSIQNTISCEEDSEEESESFARLETSEWKETGTQEVKSDDLTIKNTQDLSTSYQSNKAPQRKNTETEEHHAKLEEDKKDFRSNSLPRRYSWSPLCLTHYSSHPTKLDAFELADWTVPRISKELQQHLQSEEFRQLKNDWQFQVKAEKWFDKEDNRRRYTGLDKVYSKIRVASGNQEERAKLAIVEDSDTKFSNNDVILCKKGSLISKSWIVKNVGWTLWPKNVRLKAQDKYKNLVVPMILDRLNPGDKMILTVNYQIPEYFEEENDVHYITLNLYSKGFGDFGMKLILSFNVDDDLFDLKCKVEGKQKYIERVKMTNL